MRRLLLVGGGHAHAWVLRQLARRPIPGTEVTLVSPYRHQTYSGMLPGFVAGHYALEDIRIDLSALAARAGAAFALGQVAALDASRRQVRLAGGSALEYDAASLNVGSASGAPPEALAVKPFETFLQRWQEVRESVRRIAVVGAGAGGVEIAMAAAHRTRAAVTLYSERPMFRASIARRIERALERNGVALRAGVAVEGVASGPVVVAAGARETYDLVVWTAGAVSLPWLHASGLATDARGFVLVDDTLRSVSHPEVFAAGDCATLSAAPHPKSGVYAVRHAAVLERNLRGARQRYRPRRRALALISCGARYAIADWGGLSIEGAWVWRWKDRLDRRWVEGFR